MIPFISFNYKKEKINREILDSIKNILESEKYILGPNTFLFEKQYAQLINSDYSVGLGSGLEALIASLKSLESLLLFLKF